MYQVLLSNSDISQIDPTKQQSPVPLPTLQGCSFRIHNQTEYGLFVLSGTTPIDHLLPNDFVVMPSEAGLSVQIDPAVKASITQPYQRVTMKTIKGVVNYQYGSGWQQNGQTQVTEIVQAIQATITSGNVDATIQNASVPVSGSVDISSGSVNATIQNAQIDTNVVNTTGSPVYSQSTTGAYSSSYDFNINGSGSTGNNGNPQAVLIDASVGGYIKTLFVGLYPTNSQSTEIFLYNGSSQIAKLVASASASTNASLNFGDGVPNNGITVQGDGGSDTWELNGYGAISQNTPPAVPKSLV